jgi:hypothetical protein
MLWQAALHCLVGAFGPLAHQAVTYNRFLVLSHTLWGWFGFYLSPASAYSHRPTQIVGRINSRQDLTVSQGAQMLIKREFTWKSGAAREVARAEAPVPLAIELRD